MARRRRGLTATTLVVLAPLLAACGTGSPAGDDSAAPTEAPTVTTTTTDDPSASTSVSEGRGVRTWRVFRGEVAVLVVRAEPGPIVSSAAPPPDPDQPPVTHPFLSASALDASSEAELRRLLDASASVEEFLDHLATAGYRVVEG